MSENATYQDLDDRNQRQVDRAIAWQDFTERKCFVISTYRTLPNRQRLVLHLRALFAFFLQTPQQCSIRILVSH